ESSNPASCWDDERAESLLRSQSTPGELRELGMSEAMIGRIFGSPLAVGRSPSDPPRPTANRQQPTGSFTIRVEARFEAAHYLREYRGVSEPLHGHSYKVEADLAARGGGIDSDAISVDFISARQKLELLARKLDYGCINDVPRLMRSIQRRRTLRNGSTASCRRRSRTRASFEPSRSGRDQ